MPPLETLQDQIWTSKEWSIAGSVDLSIYFGVLGGLVFHEVPLAQPLLAIPEAPVRCTLLLCDGGRPLSFDAFIVFSFLTMRGSFLRSRDSYPSPPIAMLANRSTLLLLIVCTSICIDLTLQVLHSKDFTPARRHLGNSKPDASPSRSDPGTATSTGYVLNVQPSGSGDAIPNALHSRRTILDRDRAFGESELSKSSLDEPLTPLQKTPDRREQRQSVPSRLPEKRHHSPRMRLQNKSDSYRGLIPSPSPRRKGQLQEKPDNREKLIEPIVRARQALKLTTTKGLLDVDQRTNRARKLHRLPEFKNEMQRDSLLLNTIIQAKKQGLPESPRYVHKLSWQDEQRLQRLEKQSEYHIATAEDRRRAYHKAKERSRSMREAVAKLKIIGILRTSVQDPVVTADKYAVQYPKQTPRHNPSVFQEPNRSTFFASDWVYVIRLRSPDCRSLRN